MALSWIPDLDLYDPPDTFTEKATPMMNCYGRGKRRPNIRTLQFPKKLLEIISLQPGATKKSIKETPKVILYTVCSHRGFSIMKVKIPINLLGCCSVGLDFGVLLHVIDFCINLTIIF